MKKLRTAFRYIFDSDYRFVINANKGKYDSMDDEEYLIRKYRGVFGKKLDLAHPVTFNEKIQWLKLYDRDPKYTVMVDKYAAKQYVADIIGEEHIIPTIGVWDRAEDVDFDALPDRFVLKCTHDSSGLVICRDKSSLDIAQAREKLARGLRRDYYLRHREWPYRDVPRRIIAEPYMEDHPGKGELTDYKLHFFSGECKAVMVGQNRFGPNGLENDYYTPEWEHFDFTRGKSHNAPVPGKRPEQMDEMLRLGKMLAGDRPFVRIDFYLIEGKIYFGEITFFPASGYNPFHPDKWDRIYGDWIKLPTDK